MGWVRLDWEFVSPVGYCASLSHRVFSSPVSLRKAMALGQLTIGTCSSQRLPCTFSFSTWVSTWSYYAVKFPCLRTGTGPQCPRVRKPAPLGYPGTVFVLLLLAGRSLPSRLFLPPRCLPLAAAPHLEHGSPSLYLNLNCPRSGCEDAKVAFGVFSRLPVLGHPSSQHLMLVPALSSCPPNTVHFTSLHVPRHPIVLPYLPST